MLDGLKNNMSILSVEMLHRSRMCTEAVELGSLDPKVCITSNSFSLSTCILCYLFFLYLLKCLLHVILHPGAFAGFLWCASEGK